MHREFNHCYPPALYNLVFWSVCHGFFWKRFPTNFLHSTLQFLAKFKVENRKWRQMFAFDRWGGGLGEDMWEVSFTSVTWVVMHCYSLFLLDRTAESWSKQLGKTETKNGSSLHEFTGIQNISRIHIRGGKLVWYESGEGRVSRLKFIRPFSRLKQRERKTLNSH